MKRILEKAHKDHETLHQIAVSGGHQNPYLQTLHSCIASDAESPLGWLLSDSHGQTAFVLPESSSLRLYM